MCYFHRVNIHTGGAEDIEIKVLLPMPESRQITLDWTILYFFTTTYSLVKKKKKETSIAFKKVETSIAFDKAVKMINFI